MNNWRLKKSAPTEKEIIVFGKEKTRIGVITPCKYRINGALCLFEFSVSGATGYYDDVDTDLDYADITHWKNIPSSPK